MRFKKIKDIKFINKPILINKTKITATAKEEYATEIPYELLLQKDINKKSNK